MGLIDIAFVEIARQFLLIVTGELDKYTSVKGIIEVEGINRVTLFSPSHIQFAKYGRAPGKKPPLDPILEWVKAEGIIFDGTDSKGTAFAIQASIGKNGTLNYKKDAPSAIEEAITGNFDKYNKEVSDMVAFQINDDINEFYKEVIPEKGVIKL